MNALSFSLFIFLTTFPISLSLLGGAVVKLNGVNIDAPFTLLTGGAPITLQTVVSVTSAPSTLQIAITGLAVTLGSGKSGTIFIQKLSN